MGSKRTHQSDEAEIVVRPETEQQGTFKPKGFWYSVDGDWERWCAEDSGWTWKHTHEVALGDENMLYIRTVEELDAFNRKYRCTTGASYQREYVDWANVGAEYDGIEIAPYQRDRRLHGEGHMWYYSWDCASGCIWRPKGVKASLQKVNV